MKKVVIPFACGIVLTAGLTLAPDKSGNSSTEAKTELAPIVLHESTVISALQSKARIVAPTGKVSKTVHTSDENFFGHRNVKMTVKGDFILGVDSKDIDISVVDNTIKVRLPQPEIVSLTLPYDQMTVSEDKSLLRKETSDEALKLLYWKAEKQVRMDIENDNEVQAKAEKQMEKAVSQLLLKINGVQHVVFEEEN